MDFLDAPLILQNSAIHFTFIHRFIIRNILKDISEQPNGEVHRAKSRRVPTQELLSCGVRMHHPSSWHKDVSTDKDDSKLHCLGVFMEISIHRHDQYELNLQSQRLRVELKVPGFSSRLGLSGHQSPS